MDYFLVLITSILALCFTSLGLALTKSLVDLHSGSLDLQSQLGVGTSTMVRFPVTQTVLSPRDTNAVGIGDRKAG